jgi:sugar lactone lactonase YvrE
MLPEAKSEDLLYVANTGSNSSRDCGSVTIYTYPQGKLVGKLKGFNRPNGLCVDKAGDVFVANFSGETMVEYVHGDTKPIETLADDGTPNGCAIDPTTGQATLVWR